MAEGLRKAKKRNFTEVEAETLVGEVEARKGLTHGAHRCIYSVMVIRLTENTLDKQFVITHVKCS